MQVEAKLRMLKERPDIESTDRTKQSGMPTLATEPVDLVEEQPSARLFSFSPKPYAAVEAKSMLALLGEWCRKVSRGPLLGMALPLLAGCTDDEPFAPATYSNSSKPTVAQSAAPPVGWIGAIGEAELGWTKPRTVESVEQRLDRISMGAAFLSTQYAGVDVDSVDSCVGAVRQVVDDIRSGAAAEPERVIEFAQQLAGIGNWVEKAGYNLRQFWSDAAHEPSRDEQPKEPPTFGMSCRSADSGSATFNPPRDPYRTLSEIGKAVDVLVETTKAFQQRHPGSDFGCLDACGAAHEAKLEAMARQNPDGLIATAQEILALVKTIEAEANAMKSWPDQRQRLAQFKSKLEELRVDVRRFESSEYLFGIEPRTGFPPDVWRPASPEKVGNLATELDTVEAAVREAQAAYETGLQSLPENLETLNQLVDSAEWASMQIEADLDDFFSYTNLLNHFILLIVIPAVLLILAAILRFEMRSSRDNATTRESERLVRPAPEVEAVVPPPPEKTPEQLNAEAWEKHG